MTIYTYTQLAIDAAGSKSTTAILQTTNTISEWMGTVDAKHSETLLQGIDYCLKQTALTFPDLEFLSIGIGPGMFTGLRIGITTTKILSDIYNFPVVPVSSLHALALQGKSFIMQNNLHSIKRIWALNDARRGEVYALTLPIDQITTDYNFTESETIALTPQAAASRMQVNDFIIGEGAQVFSEIWPNFVTIAPDSAHALSAQYIGQIGYNYFKNKKIVDRNKLAPRYLHSYVEQTKKD